MFWSIWTILYTDYEQEFLCMAKDCKPSEINTCLSDAVKVIAAYVRRLDFNDDSVCKVFLSSVPNDKYGLASCSHYCVKPV